MHVILQQLSDGERDAVLSRIEEIRAFRASHGYTQNAVTAKWLAQVLTEAGHPVSQLVMSTHIRKDCACGY